MEDNNIQDSCCNSKYASIRQMDKLDEMLGRRFPFYPRTVIQAVHDGRTGASLEAILAQYNNIYVQYQGTAGHTRNIVPKEMRRKGIIISYVDMQGNAITEKCVNDAQKDNFHWGLDVNWVRVDELTLSGDISVSVKGTWVINGEDTGIAALGPKGDNGLTPWLKTIDNKLHFSYDNETWEVCSDYIAAYFRFQDNKFQISRDNKTWSDLSGEVTNSLSIKAYVTDKSQYPNPKQGDMIMVGPTYADDDTEHTKPIYHLNIYNAGGWVDHGPFQSINAGVVQELGDSETEVMSQKAVSKKISECENRLDYFNPTKLFPGTTYTIDTALQKLKEFEESNYTNILSGFRLCFTNDDYEYEEWKAVLSNNFDKSNWIKQANISEDEFSRIKNGIESLDKKANLWNPTKQVSPSITYNIDTALEAAQNKKILFDSGDKIGFTNSEYKYEEWLCTQNNSYDVSDWEKVCVRYNDIDKKADKNLYGYIHYDMTIQNPSGGIEGTNKYTLDIAAPLVPAELRNIHTKLIFLNSKYQIEEWVCTNNSDWLNTSSSSWIKTGVSVIKDIQDKTEYPIQLSNDGQLNKIIKELYIKNVSLDKIEKIYIYNGFNNSESIQYGIAVKTADKIYYYVTKKNISDSSFYQHGDLYAVINWGAINDTRYETQDGFSFNPILGSEVSNFPIISQHLITNEEVDVVIGDKIYAIVGDRLQLFHKGIFNCKNIDNYIIRIECSKGKSYPRYFEYTPTSNDIGNTDITFSIYKPSSLTDYTGTLVASKKCQLITINTDKESPSSLRRFLLIGDSTITAGIYQNEAFRRLTASDGTPIGIGLNNIKFVGRKTSDKRGVTTGYEGTSGWSWDNYVSPISKTILFNVIEVTNVNIDDLYAVQSGNVTLRMLVMEINITEGKGYIRCSYNSDSPSYSATPDSSGTMKKLSGGGDLLITYTSIEEDMYSPFYNTETSEIDITSYVNEYCEGNIDYFIPTLGINSISRMYSNNKTIDTIVDEVKTLIDAVHSEFPNVKILISTIPMPSQVGGVGASYNASYRAVKEDYQRRAFKINTEYIRLAESSDYSSFISIINLCAEFDSDYLYPTTEVTANPRTITKEIRGTNAAHPSDDGYLSEGDIIFRYLYGVVE